MLGRQDGGAVLFLMYMRTCSHFWHTNRTPIINPLHPWGVRAEWGIVAQPIETDAGLVGG